MFLDSWICLYRKGPYFSSATSALIELFCFSIFVYFVFFLIWGQYLEYSGSTLDSLHVRTYKCISVHKHALCRKLCRMDSQAKLSLILKAPLTQRKLWLFSLFSLFFFLRSIWLHLKELSALLEKENLFTEPKGIIRWVDKKEKARIYGPWYFPLVLLVVLKTNFFFSRIHILPYSFSASCTYQPLSDTNSALKIWLRTFN